MYRAWAASRIPPPVGQRFTESRRPMTAACTASRSPVSPRDLPSSRRLISEADDPVAAASSLIVSPRTCRAARRSSPMRAARRCHRCRASSACRFLGGMAAWSAIGHYRGLTRGLPGGGTTSHVLAECVSSRDSRPGTGLLPAHTSRQPGRTATAWPLLPGRGIARWSGRVRVRAGRRGLAVSRSRGSSAAATASAPARSVTPTGWDYRPRAGRSCSLLGQTAGREGLAWPLVPWAGTDGHILAATPTRWDGGRGSHGDDPGSALERTERVCQTPPLRWSAEGSAA